MARTSNKKISNIIEKEIYQELLFEFKKIKSREDLNLFFKKFLTESEKGLIFRRLAAMKLLKQGKKYMEIRKLLEISNDVISKASRIFKAGEYKQDPENKRKYSISNYKKYKKRRHYGLKYKGSAGISGMIDDISDILQ